MKLIIALSAVAFMSCGLQASQEMVAKSKHVYRTQDTELQYILSSISDRLDRLEGLRGDAAEIVARTASIDGTFIPILTTQQPGDLVVTYSSRSGIYTKIGNLVIAQISIATTAFTQTTASGTVRITGLPFAAADVTDVINVGVVSWDGFTKASYSHLTARILNGQSYVDFVWSGSGQTVASAFVADVTSGFVTLRLMIIYKIE